MRQAALRHSFVLRAGVVLAALALLEASCGGCVPVSQRPGNAESPPGEGRGQELIVDPDADEAALPFDPTQSAGLFVGVRDFKKLEETGGLGGTSYAVDDAVDLAYLFSIELGLVAPNRVTLLLSGEPENGSSRKRLEELIVAKALRFEANRSEILDQLANQVDRAGRQGLLVVTFSAHGKRDQGSDYVLPADAVQRFPIETSFDTRSLFTQLDRAEARRKIVLLDICREVLRPGARGPSRDPDFTASPELINLMKKSEGEVILSAARANGVAWEDSGLGHGVFTAAVLDALHCKAKPDAEGRLTAAGLVDFVNERVIAWTRKHRPGEDLKGIESRLSGLAAEMPLATCGVPPPDCRQIKVEAVEIHTGPGGVRRLVPPQNRLSLAAREAESLENLTVHAVLSGPSAALKQCVCRWEKQNESSTWDPLETTGEGCSLSIAPPSPYSKVVLQLTAGKSTLPITIDLQ